ncbi:hypothetical protein ACJZ2D_013893 [Fusarium nematophilum]
MSKSKAWADGIPTQGTRKLAAEMTIVHNLLLRGINSVHNQAVNVGARGMDKDKLGFANYAYTWGDVLTEHHETEEAMIFPDIEKITEVPGLMEGSVSEHHAFHQGLLQYREYLDQIRGGGAEYDGQRLAATMHHHLVHEVEALVALDKHEDKIDWARWFKKTIDAIVSKDMKDSRFRTDLFPMTMVLHDKSFEGGAWGTFPPVPWLVLVVLRWMFMTARKEWWRFASCDYNSLPQELPFA